MKIKFCDKYILLVSKIDKNIIFCLLLIGYEKVFGNKRRNHFTNLHFSSIISLSKRSAND